MPHPETVWEQGVRLQGYFIGKNAYFSIKSKLTRCRLLTWFLSFHPQEHTTNHISGPWGLDWVEPRNPCRIQVLRAAFWPFIPFLPFLLSLDSCRTWLQVLALRLAQDDWKKSHWPLEGQGPGHFFMKLLTFSIKV